MEEEIERNSRSRGRGGLNQQILCEGKKAIFSKGGVHSFCSSLLPDTVINDMSKRN